MTTRFERDGITRRELLRRGTLAAGALAVPGWIFPAYGAWPQAGAAQTADPVDAMRQQMGAPPIERLKLTDNLTLLSGPGGNVVVLTGPDGKFVVDTFVQPAWPRLQTTLQELGSGPIQTVIDTHWHFDHADNNANFRKAGATILAHENTGKRMSQTHDFLGMKFPASPPEALPTKTFKDTHSLTANGEQIALGYIPPAHTDTDIYIRFSKADVLHLGDLYFNGMYPFIDAGTGGNIAGMIAGADMALKLAGGSTRIVPGHGPLAKREDLTNYRDMLATVRDRVQKLKKGGSTLDQVVAAAPTKDFDPIWGKGFMQPKDFLALVYNTL